MADNVAITAGSGTTVAADEVTDGTLGSCKVQFMKLMDGTLDSTNKLVVDSNGEAYVRSPDLTASGNITTQNLNLNSGTATAGSTVALSTLNGVRTVGIQVTGTFSGNLLVQGTVDGSNWQQIKELFDPINLVILVGTGSGTPYIVLVDVAGYQQVRMTAASSVTGTAVVTMRASAQGSRYATIIEGSLPAGTNVLGGVINYDQTMFGTITTQNLNPTGGATFGSSVGINSPSNGASTACFQITGTYTGALTPQASVDGNNWVTLPGLMNVNTGAFSATVPSAATGIYALNVAGFYAFRLTALAAVTGTATVTCDFSHGGNFVTQISPLPAGSNTLGSVKVTDGTNTMPTQDVAARAGFVKVTDGTNSMPTLDTVGRAGFVKVTDGTNSQPTMDVASRAGFEKITDGTNTAAVKAASTAPVATDSALVVAVSPNTPTLATTPAGNVASGSTDSGNPVKIGGVAHQSNPTAVSDGQRVNAAFDDLGRQVVVLGNVRDLIGKQNTTISSTTETTIVTAGGAGVFADLVQLVLTNSSSTAVTVTIKDSTAGTTQLIVDLAANGGAVIPFQRPVPQTTANNNWTATLSAGSITVHVFALYEKNV